MAQLDVRQKLEILADAAKYDASCASSGTTKRNSKDGKGLGSTEGMGICHAYAPDGRCISLLKILLTNSCFFDCHYCINRKSSNVRRARFTAKEVVDLTISFYKRNYIEGLFLSSGIIGSSNYTMEQLVEVARSLREDHDFRGYIHLKTIPDADPELVAAAGRHADRVSINVELPTTPGLKRLAPEKSAERIAGAMGEMKASIIDARDASKHYKSAPRYAPAGQSTQMIVGADAATDSDIVLRASGLYDAFGMRRVYYSAFSPIPDASAILPLKRPPLMRERCLRTQFISEMLAPLSSRARLTSCLCASVRPSTGRVSSAEPPPEIRHSTKSFSVSPCTIASMRSDACIPAASGTGCAASTTSMRCTRPAGRGGVWW